MVGKFFCDAKDYSSLFDYAKLLTVDATQTGKSYKFRELKRLRSWKKNVNRGPKAT
jgi:hypothetical protein